MIRADNIPADMPLKGIAGIYNYIATDRNIPRVTKFPDRKTALKRTEQMLKEAGLTVQIVEDDRQWTLVPVENKGTDGATKKVNDKPTKNTSAVTKKGDDRVITLLAKQNPKRPGTQAAATFAHYKSGMTVGDFHKAVGNRKVATLSLAYDQEHGYISVK